MHAAEALAQRLGQSLRERVDGKTRGVACEHRVICEMRGDPVVERLLQIHALGDRLDHQIAIAQLLQMLIVVGGFDIDSLGGRGQRSGLDLVQILDRSTDVRVGIGVLRRKLEQDHGHIRVDEMRGDLRAHDAGAEHGGLADLQSRSAS